MTIAFGGRRTTFDLPGWYCPACGESQHTPADMDAYDAALLGLERAAGAAPPPEDPREATRV